MGKALDHFISLMKKANKLDDDCYSVTTAIRKTLIIPLGFKLYDTDIGAMFIGDGVSYGGKSQDSKEEVRLIVTAAASAATSNDTFVTIASAADGIFTSVAHGYAVGDVVTAMTTDATYGLTADTEYTVATITDDTFTLTGVTPEDQTADVVLRDYSLANNNKLTWAQAAYLRTGDAVTMAAGTGTLPSGISATTYYIVKDDTAANGGIDKNVTTVFKLSDSRAHALAGSDIVVVRDGGAAGFTAVTADVYLRPCDKTVSASFAAAGDIYLPSAVTYSYKRYEINNAGAANCTVKSEAGTVNGVAAGTGVVLKASSNDYAVVVSNATNWVSYGIQITA